MNNEPICPCEDFIHPRVMDNPPGMDSISYRVGDFTTFRHALLLPLLDSAGNHIETELRFWRPTPSSDLSLQLVEWWAYIADILTFYNERIANEMYLRTTTQPASVSNLIRLLGYRPRPGIGARGVVAALLAPGAKSAVLLQGMGLQNKPSPGKQPQIFELDQALSLVLPDAVSADIAPKDVPSTVAVQSSMNRKGSAPSQISAPLTGSSIFSAIGNPAPKIDSLLLKGEVSGFKPGAPLLLVERGWNGKDSHYGWVSLIDTNLEKDPRGKTNTRLNFAAAFEPWPGFDVRNTRVMSSAQSAHLWPYPSTVGVIESNKVHLDRLAKQIGSGDMLLFEQDSGATLFLVSSYEEILWYSNPPSGQSPITPPGSPVPPVAVLHSLIGLTPNPLPTWKTSPGSVSIHYAWTEIGQLIATPVTVLNSNNADGKLSTLVAVGADGTQAVGTAFPANLENTKVFIEDVDGQGVVANASTDSTGSTLTLSGLPDQSYVLKTPLKVLFNLLSISRGKTVGSEILGSGDARVAGQEFILKNTPLTYFLSADSRSGDNYRSTLRIWVDNIEWMEVPNFFGRSPSERIFVTREDEDRKTHIFFGDGINGARVSSGINNVIARYRFGSGEEIPPSTSLTIILQPQPGLKAIRNPVAVGGGADPDPPSRIRKFAPRSVLTFGRAVSADDYEVVAAQAPGVSRAKSVWNIDAASQRAMPIIYVGDDASAVASARQAINFAADPNRPLTVSLARKIPIKLQLVLTIAGNYATQPVVEAVLGRLTDADSGLFGFGNVGIGQAFFRSEIDSTCLRVDGVVAVHGIRLWSDKGAGFIDDEPGSRYDPGIDGFYSLALENLDVSYEQVAL